MSRRSTSKRLSVSDVLFFSNTLFVSHCTRRRKVVIALSEAYEAEGFSPIKLTPHPTSPMSCFKAMLVALEPVLELQLDHSLAS